MPNQAATARSARFSARVPEIGHTRWLCTTSTSSSAAGEARELLLRHVLELGVAGGVRALMRGGQFFAPSHMANPIMAVMPTTNAMKPSDIGPMPPSGLPPGLLL